MIVPKHSQIDLRSDSWRCARCCANSPSKRESAAAVFTLHLLVLLIPRHLGRDGLEIHVVRHIVVTESGDCLSVPLTLDTRLAACHFPDLLLRLCFCPWTPIIVSLQISMRLDFSMLGSNGSLPEQEGRAATQYCDVLQCERPSSWRPIKPQVQSLYLGGFSWYVVFARIGILGVGFEPHLYHTCKISSVNRHLIAIILTYICI